MQVVASIEARMGSSRLPGKVLADIGGQTALDRLVARLRGCTMLDDIIVATSTGAADDAIANWATHAGVALHRGSEEDVLQRVCDAHAFMQSDIIVEITGDCPLIDPSIVDFAVKTFLDNDCDVVTTAHRPSFPQGTDVQVFRADALKHVADTISDPAVREHVSLHFYETPEQYRVLYLSGPARYQAPDLRLQLDYPEDLEFIRKIYAELEPCFGPLFDTVDILTLLKERPDLQMINAHCQEKSPRG